MPGSQQALNSKIDEKRPALMAYDFACPISIISELPRLFGGLDMKVTLTMIRKYTDNDIDAVASSWRIATEFAHPFLTKEFLDAEAIALRKAYLPATETWVTEIDGKVVGFIALMGSEIAALFLRPDYHGRGLGKAMTDKAVAEKGLLTVEVFEDNAVGRRFYDSYGFQKTGEYIFEPTGNVTFQMSLRAK